MKQDKDMSKKELECEMCYGGCMITAVSKYSECSCECHTLLELETPKEVGEKELEQDWKREFVSLMAKLVGWREASVDTELISLIEKVEDQALEKGKEIGRQEGLEEAVGVIKARIDDDDMAEYLRDQNMPIADQILQEVQALKDKSRALKR